MALIQYYNNESATRWMEIIVYLKRGGGASCWSAREEGGEKDKKITNRREKKLYFSHAHKLEIGIIQFKYQYQDLNEKWTWLKRIIAAKT